MAPLGNATLLSQPRVTVTLLAAIARVFGLFELVFLRRRPRQGQRDRYGRERWPDNGTACHALKDAHARLHYMQARRGRQHQAAGP